MNVGYWIQGQSREYTLFIAHRVGEIHEFSAPNHWHYVPTNVNPADVGTRGLTVEELAKCRLVVEWARISEEVKTRLARVQVCQANVNV